MSTIGYMCLTDYEHELGFASGGCAVYPSIDDLKSYRKCVESCGIIEVQVNAVKIIQEENHDLHN